MWYNIFNMELIIKNIGIGIMVTGLTVANWFGVVPKDYFVPEVREVETKVVHEYLPVPLGASVSTPDVKALFTTSLASKITSSATSMTLVSATDKDGTTLASSTYGFILDEGTSVEEFVLADCTGTACTNMTRGISVSTATTSVAALKFEHRRGASVKITTAPSLVFVMNVLKGKQSIENKLRYSSTQTFNNATDIISRDYADSLAFGAIPASSETASGFVELATTLEGASSTSSGSAARLVLPASSATSTYNSATAPLRVVVTQNNGTIDGNFIPTTIPNNHTFSGVTTLATSTLTNPSAILDSSGNGAFFRFLASTTLAAPATTMTLSNIGTSTLLKIYVYSPAVGAGAGSALQLRFNGDTGSNYSYGFATTTLAGASSDTKLVFSTNVTTTSAAEEAKFSTLEVFAIGSTTKAVTFSTTHYNGKVNVPVTLGGSGTWSLPTAGAISSIILANASGGNLPAGTIIYVFGSAF